MDLMQEIQNCFTQLELTIKSARKYDLDYAEKEKIYKMELSKRLTQLRAEGKAVTHLADIARGEEKIATLRYNRDIALGMKDSAKETINYLKLKLRILENQYEREWGQTKRI